MSEHKITIEYEQEMDYDAEYQSRIVEGVIDDIAPDLHGWERTVTVEPCDSE